jgi:acetoacetyl-CoA reductase
LDTPLYVVVGGSSALGCAVVEGLLREERRVVATHHRRKPEHRAGCVQVQCDVNSPDDCASLATSVSGMSDRIFVVYMAGLSRNAMLHKTGEDDWNEVVGVNLTGAFRTARAFLPWMREKGYGRFVFAGSVTGRLAPPGTGPYSASKEGLKGLARVIASENAARGITANILEIGYMDCGLTETIPEPVRESIRRTIPAGAFGPPGDLVPVLLMLEKAGYVNGAVIAVSGGL